MSRDSAQLFERSSTVEEAPLQGESILFCPDANRFYVLNPSAAFIWGQLGEPMCAQDIADRICEKFSGITAVDALRDVQCTLAEMESLDVIRVVATKAAD